MFYKIWRHILINYFHSDLKSIIFKSLIKVIKLVYNFFIESKIIIFVVNPIMNFIGNLFRSPSKNQNNKAKINKKVQFLSP